MAFTREFVRRAAKESGVELPKEFEDALVNEHISARDIFANSEVKRALEENKAASVSDVKDTQEYKDLKKEFEDYKTQVEAKETSTAKETAYRNVLKAANFKPDDIDMIVRVARSEGKIDSLVLDKDGIAKEFDALKDSAKTEWKRFANVVTDVKHTPDNPLNNMGGAKLTKADIYKKNDNGRYVMSATERQKALAENPELMR